MPVMKEKPSKNFKSNDSKNGNNSVILLKNKLFHAKFS